MSNGFESNDEFRVGERGALGAGEVPTTLHARVCSVEQPCVTSAIDGQVLAPCPLGAMRWFVILAACTCSTTRFRAKHKLSCLRLLNTHCGVR